MSSQEEIDYKLPPAKRDELLQDPKVKKLLLPLTIVSAYLVFLPTVFIVLHALQIVPPADVSGGQQSMWWGLVVVSAFSLLSLVPIFRMVGRNLWAAKTVEQAKGRAIIYLIFPLSIAELIAVCGLISPMFGAPRAAGWGMLAAGILTSVIIALTARPRAVSRVLLAVLEERED